MSFEIPFNDSVQCGLSSPRSSNSKLSSLDLLLQIYVFSVTLFLSFLFLKSTSECELGKGEVQREKERES